MDRSALMVSAIGFLLKVLLVFAAWIAGMTLVMALVMRAGV